MARRNSARRSFPATLWQALTVNRPSQPRPRTRLGLECLEDRRVLSTFTVNSLLDPNPPTGVTTLREAILAANSDPNATAANPDVINFSVAGTIALSSQLPSLSSNVSIQGPGASSLTIEGGQLGGAIFTVGASATATISGLTIDGSLDGNSGISVGAAATLGIQNVTIQHVNGTNGGAIDSEAGGTVSVAGVRFLGDGANSAGGAIANIGGSLTVADSTFDRDLAGQLGGGAIYDSANRAGVGGGLTVLASTFTNDQSEGDGGAVALSNGVNAVIGDSTFTADSANNNGGAIFIGFIGTSAAPTLKLDLSGSTVDGNTAGSSGGGLFVSTQPESFVTTVVVRDSIVVGNSALVFGGGQTQSVPSDVNGPVDPSSAANIIGDGTGLTGISNTFNANQIGTDAAPINPLLGPLQDNGGPTLTMALLPGSPALDGGVPDPVLDALTTTDQRGDERVVSQSFVPETPGFDGRDIGAYELALQTPTVLTVNSIADATPPPGVLTLREAIQAATGAIPLSSLPATQVTPGSPYGFEIEVPVTGMIVLGSQLPAIANTNVIIQGPGSASLTIQGDGQGDSILTVGGNGSAIISGVTLEGIQHANSGIAVGTNANLGLFNSVIEQCYTNGNGAAIDSESGNSKIDVANVHFLHDIANEAGGAIANIGGSLAVSNSTFDQDQAFQFSGGAILDSANRVNGGGGLTVVASTFSNDMAVGDGGGVSIGNGANVVIADSTFTGDTTNNNGGAIFVGVTDTSPAPTLTLDLSGSTLDGNTAGTIGGGLFVAPSFGSLQVTVAVQDSIVAGNSALVFEPGLTLRVPNDVNGSVVSSSAFDLIGDGTGLTGITSGSDGNRIGTDLQPINSLLQSLQNNGGATLTMALLPGSPALDAGSGATTNDTDQRGVPRGHVIDIGAYQATPSQLLVLTQSPATAGQAQLVVVEALDFFGKVSYDDQDAVSLTSSDAGAVLPAQSPLISGADTFFATFNDPGTQSLTATDQQSGLTGSQSNILVQATTTATVVSSANPSSFGQSVTFSATVNPTDPGAGTPTGTVTFLDGSVALGSASLSGGKASFSTSALSAGAHSITVSYIGASGYLSSASSVLTQTVKPTGKSATSTSLSASLSSTIYGQPVAFTAVVSGMGGTPTGTVTLMLGTKKLGSAKLSNGTATITYAFLPVGTDSVTAVYSGDGSFNGSTSPGLSQTVSKASSKNVLTVTPSPATVGQTVTLTSVLTAVAPGGGIPQGEVTFRDGTVTLGMVRMNSAGVATFQTTSLAPGNHSLMAIWFGDSNYIGSKSPVVVETINSSPLSIALRAASEAVDALNASHGNLTITLSPSAPLARVGFDLIYTILVTNHGTESVLAPVWTDSLPANVAFVGATSTLGTAQYENGTVRGEISTLAPGASATLRIIIRPLVVGLIKNFATITGTEAGVDWKFDSNVLETLVL